MTINQNTARSVFDGMHSYAHMGESEEFLRFLLVQILLQSFLFSGIPHFVRFLKSIWIFKILPHFAGFLISLFLRLHVSGKRLFLQNEKLNLEHLNQQSPNLQEFPTLYVFVYWNPTIWGIWIWTRIFLRS